MGQALLPEHFYAQEQSLREEASLRFRMSAAPAWGLAELKWDEFQLQKGIISIQEMTLFLKSGVIVDIPGNTGPAFINLNTAGKPQVTVYVHLQSAFETVDVRQSEGDDGIARIMQKIELSTEAYSETAAESFTLAEVSCDPDGLWSLKPSFVPALLQAGAEPFSPAYVSRMDGIARGLRHMLVQELEQNYLAAEGQASAKQCMRGLFGFQAAIADLRSEIRLHPYDLFRVLRDLYLDVCVFRGVQAELLEKPYAHEDLATCVGGLLDELEEQMQIGRARLPYVEFEHKDGMFVCTLGKEVRRAKDVFVLIQKPQISTKLDLSRVKFAAESRIHTVHERALRGIPFIKVESPPFAHGLSSSVDFYALSPGQEWDYAVSEGKVVFFEAPSLVGCREYLYWREE